MATRRILAGLVGVPILLCTLVEAYFQSFGFYREHFSWPIEKYGALTPLRWQDIVFLVVFWIAAIASFYLSFRLLRFAFRGSPRDTSVSTANDSRMKAG
jgi:NADH:ubiquinone oxidoreductase subunit 5 (subunit L)/multisubunit Na+/H+ antiporter MnhA subunit